MRDFNSDGVLVGRPKLGLNYHGSEQIYPCGTIHERHGRRYRYCHAVEDFVFAGRGNPNLAHIPWHAENTYGVRGAVKVAVKAGDNKVIVKINDSIVTNSRIPDYFVDGVAWMLEPNEAGTAGYVVIRPRISGSDISYADTDASYEDILIYLDEPLIKDIAAAQQCDLYPSPYRNIGASASVGVYASVVCVACSEADDGDWFWGQTRGPCWCTPTAGITAGATRMVVFANDGAIKAAPGSAEQIAGYLLHRGDGAQDDAEIMLMLE